MKRLLWRPSSDSANTPADTPIYPEVSAHAKSISIPWVPSSATDLIRERGLLWRVPPRYQSWKPAPTSRSTLSRLPLALIREISSEWLADQRLEHDVEVVDVLTKNLFYNIAIPDAWSTENHQYNIVSSEDMLFGTTANLDLSHPQWSSVKPKPFDFERSLVSPTTWLRNRDTPATWRRSRTMTYSSIEPTEDPSTTQFRSQDALSLLERLNAWKAAAAAWIQGIQSPGDVDILRLFSKLSTQTQRFLNFLRSILDLKRQEMSRILPQTPTFDQPNLRGDIREPITRRDRKPWSKYFDLVDEVVRYPSQVRESWHGRDYVREQREYQQEARFPTLLPDVSAALSAKFDEFWRHDVKLVARLLLKFLAEAQSLRDVLSIRHSGGGFSKKKSRKQKIRKAKAAL